MVGQTEQTSFSLGRTHQQAATGQRTRRIGLVISLTLALFATLALPAATFAANSNTVAVVRSTGADLYDAPDGAVIQSLARGSALEAIGRTADGAWLKVTTADGVTGWTPAARLVVFGVDNLPALSDAPAKPAQSSATVGSKAITSTTSITGTVTTVGESLNMRAGPGTDLRDHRRPLSRRDAGARRSKQIYGLVGCHAAGWKRYRLGFVQFRARWRAIRRGCPSRIG